MTKEELTDNVRAVVAVAMTVDDMVDGLVIVVQAYVDALRARDAGVPIPVFNRLPQPIMVPCPTCSGDAWEGSEDRHTRTAKDVCQTCKGKSVIPAATGTSRETSAPVATPDPVEVDLERKRYLGQL